MKDARRGICVAPARESFNRLFRDSTVMGASRLGFSTVRFNPGIDDLRPTGPGTVSEGIWQFVDNHVQRCIHQDLDILLTLDRPPTGGSWYSTVDEDGWWEWDSLDYDGVENLYTQIIDRILTDNSFPPERLFVEVANEASLFGQGGTKGDGATSTGEIQPTYLIALGNLIVSLKAKFPAVKFLSHAFAFVDSELIAAMDNPWATEFGAFVAPDPPLLLTACDIIQVHIYFTYKKTYGIMPWDEYARNVVALFDAWLAQRDAMDSPEWDVVKAKSVWITETGVSYKFAGMEVPGVKSGNQRELALRRTVSFDRLCFHPKAEAVFYYTIRNEDPAFDARTHDFNEGILMNDGTVTASYDLFAIANGQAQIVYPLSYEPAPELAISGY